MESSQTLKDWAKQYVKHKDIMTRQIQEIKEAQYGLDVVYQDKQIKYLISLNIKDIEPEENARIITINSPDNLKQIQNNWEKYCVEGLSIIFINPFSLNDKQWIINPKIHNKICDSESLILGLKAMAENVDPITPEEFTRSYKND